MHFRLPPGTGGPARLQTPSRGHYEGDRYRLAPPAPWEAMRFMDTVGMPLPNLEHPTKLATKLATKIFGKPWRQGRGCSASLLLDRCVRKVARNVSDRADAPDGGWSHHTYSYTYSYTRISRDKARFECTSRCTSRGWRFARRERGIGGSLDVGRSSGPSRQVRRDRTAREHRPTSDRTAWKPEGRY